MDLYELPRFDCTTPALAQEAIPRLIKRATEDLKKLEKHITPTWQGSMEPLQALTYPLEYAWGIVSHLHGTMNTQEWRTTHEQLQPAVVAFYSRLGQSEPVYRTLDAIRHGTEWENLDETRQRLIRSSLFHAESAGVGLPPAQREQMRTLHDALAANSTLFSNNLLDATKAFHLVLETPGDIAGLPRSLIKAASAAAIRQGMSASTSENGPWVISLETPLYFPFQQYSTRRDLREKLYRAFVTRASEGETDNTALIERILEDRRETARLLSAGSFADLTLKIRMADDVASVRDLIDRLHAVAYPAALRELSELETFAAENGHREALMPWDIPYWSERLRKALFDFDDEQLRAYFAFHDVLDGMFELAEKLFGVQIKPADGSTPVWHPDVRFFEISSEDGSVSASFYLDPYSRPETKRGGAWMDAVRPRRRLPDGTLIPPAAYLVCNQTLPDGDNPSRMTFTEITTLFHEFGHALQHLLTTVEIPAASGIYNVEWDAVELSSQFMENWCYEKDVLQRISCHEDTGLPLPEAHIQQIRKARCFRAGSAMLRQLLFSAVDIELHHNYCASEHESANHFKEQIAKSYTVLPMLPEDRFLSSFSHVFAGGYAAGYYSYKWAEVLSADAFSAFTETGNDAEAMMATGRRFRDTVLSMGGSRHPMELFKEFRGRAPDPDALLRQENLIQNQLA